MTNYSTTSNTIEASLKIIGAEISTYLDTIDSTKTIYAIDIETLGADNAVATIIHDA